MKQTLSGKSQLTHYSKVVKKEGKRRISIRITKYCIYVNLCHIVFAPSTLESLRNKLQFIASA